MRSWAESLTGAIHALSHRIHRSGLLATARWQLLIGAGATLCVAALSPHLRVRKLRLVNGRSRACFRETGRTATEIFIRRDAVDSARPQDVPLAVVAVASAHTPMRIACSAVSSR